MRTPIAAALALALAFALAGCKQKVDDSAANGALPQPASTQQPAAASPQAATGEAKKPPRFASAARIAEIKASGKTGFWADPAEFCPGRRVTTLTWNVESSGAQKVVVYVIDKEGKERNFGRGGPVGERQSGPWLKPGMTFKLRNQEGGAELGSITIPRGKSC
ncbi:hypothetical protein FNZ56_11275 [Pseudoluteimonas lycopersici]|uniref:Uncharacterized protein n=1 Tax=Pseudoluteimonas lycopersici TaxID=1324796 RepID=A0A516V7A5_9GAMM|nr:hypothetical protein [Lysobacter lycopersici]QDQ74417.1 hypothetical protein FNZ56_11275 [Lysobacter lycopersici]